MSSSTGQKIVAISLLAAAGAAGYNYLLTPEMQERVTTFENGCGNFDPFYDDNDTTVESCAPLVDRTTQEVVEEPFTYTLVEGSAVNLSNGNYAIGVHLDYVPDIPMRLFGVDSIDLEGLDQVLQGSDELLRSYCVDDMSRVVERAQQQTALLATQAISAYDLGTADNAYEVFPAGRGDNDVAIPDLFIYDITSRFTPEDALVTCWEP